MPRSLPGSLVPRRPDGSTAVSSGRNIVATGSLRLVEQLARQHTSRAIQVLAEVMEDRRAPAVARVSASNSLLDRGWGQAKQVVVVEQTADQLSDEDLRTEIERRLQSIYTIDGVLEPVGEAEVAGPGGSAVGPPAGSGGCCEEERDDAPVVLDDSGPDPSSAPSDAGHAPADDGDDPDFGEE